MRSLLTFLLACAGAVACAGPALAQDTAPPPADTNTVLHTGDIVRVTVWRNAEMSGDFVVGVNGALLHPLYQAVPVAGIPIHEVEDRLRTFLKKYESDPQIVVIPLLHVTVAGEVAKPSLYNFPRGTSLGEAIALAGGPTTEANVGKVLLYRANQEYRIDFRNPLNQWASQPIQSGDQIIVSRKSSFFTSVFLPLVSVAGSAASIINLTRRH